MAVTTIKKPTVIGIVPVKENSQRVPAKNFRTLGPDPLWLWPVRVLAKCPFVDLIVIDTDCLDYFTEWRRLLGTLAVPVTIDPRPTKLQGDAVSMNKILADIADRRPAFAYIQLHATSPFIQVETLDAAYEELQAGADSVYGVNEMKSRFYWPDGRPVNHDPEKLIPTQDLDPLYEENSAFYIYRGDAFDKQKARICGKSKPFIVPELQAIDIDTEADWRLAVGLSKVL